MISASRTSAQSADLLGRHDMYVILVSRSDFLWNPEGH